MHEEHRRIFETLKEQHFSGRKTSNNPRAIILCGQPGSGRDSQIPTVMQEFPGSGAVLIDESQTQGYTKNLLEKLDLRWPAGQEKARGTKALEREQHHSRARSQSEDMK